MNLRTIPRTAVGGSLKLVRLPVDAALALSGGGDSTTSVKLALDRFEATVLGFAGAALGDPVAQDDARRRAEAAREREYALRLRTEASQRSERADDRVAEREHDADRRRADAARSADSKRKQAQRRRESTRTQAGEASRRRKQAAAEAAVRTEEAIDERAKRERLEALDTRAQALDDKEVALTAADEAQRLSRAAAEVKANRKNGG